MVVSFPSSLSFSLGPCRGEVTPAVDKSKNRDTLRLHAIDESVSTDVDFSQVVLAELSDYSSAFREGCKALAGLPHLRRERRCVRR